MWLQNFILPRPLAALNRKDNSLIQGQIRYLPIVRNDELIFSDFSGNLLLIISPDMTQSGRLEFGRLPLGPSLPPTLCHSSGQLPLHVPLYVPFCFLLSTLSRDSDAGFSSSCAHTRLGYSGHMQPKRQQRQKRHPMRLSTSLVLGWQA